MKSGDYFPQFTPKTYFWQQVCIISSSIITLPSVQFLRSISVVDKVFSMQGPKSNNLHHPHHHTIPCKTIVEKDTEGNPTDLTPSVEGVE